MAAWENAPVLSGGQQQAQPSGPAWADAPILSGSNPDPYQAELNDSAQRLVNSPDIKSQRDVEDIAARMPDYQQSREAASQYDTRDIVAKALGNNIAPMWQHPESIPGAIFPILDLARDVRGAVANPKSLLGPSIASGKFSPVDLTKQENMDELVGALLGGAGAVHGASRGFKALRPAGESVPPEAVATEAPGEKPTVAAPAPAPTATTSDITLDALRWRDDLLRERRDLAKSRDLEAAVAGRPTARTEGRIAEIDDELKQGYQPESADPNVDAEKNSPTVNANAPAEPVASDFRPEEEPAQGAETDLLKVAPKRPNYPVDGEPAGVENTPAPEPGAEAGQGSAGTAPAQSGPSNLGLTGVSRAARDTSGEVKRTEAPFLSVEDHLRNGERVRNDLRARGGNEEGFINNAVQRGSFNSDEIGLAILKDTELTEAARRARKIANDNPSRADLGRAATVAENATQVWEDHAIRPIRGQFNQTGTALQTAVDLDTGSVVDYEKAFRATNRRAPTPREKTKLVEASRRAQKANEGLTREVAEREARSQKKLGANKVLRGDDLIKSLRELKEQLLRDCQL